MRDGNLRQLFREHLPEAHWVPVETWSTGQGVPDSEYCFPGGASGWIENKKTSGWRVFIEPHQVAWLERRARAGGRCFVAIRRKTETGPRRGKASDELILIRGRDARLLVDGDIKSIYDKVLHCYGGPSRWDWEDVRRALKGG